MYLLKLFEFYTTHHFPALMQYGFILCSSSLNGVCIPGRWGLEMVKDATTVQQVQPSVNSTLYGRSVHSQLSLHNNRDYCSFKNVFQNVRNPWVSQFKNKKTYLGALDICIEEPFWIPDTVTGANYTTLCHIGNWIKYLDATHHKAKDITIYQDPIHCQTITTLFSILAQLINGD